MAYKPHKIENGNQYPVRLALTAGLCRECGGRLHFTLDSDEGGVFYEADCCFSLYTLRPDTARAVVEDIPHAPGANEEVN